MGFFIAMFLCNLLMPSIMVIAGYCMYKNPPKEINGLIGYRTAMSEKNKDTWALRMTIAGSYGSNQASYCWCRRFSFKFRLQNRVKM